MITDWQTLPIMLGNHHVHEIDAKLDLSHGPRGWHVCGVLVEDLDSKDTIRIDRDGTINRGNERECSLIGPALVSMADHYFSQNRDDLLACFGIVEAA